MCAGKVNLRVHRPWGAKLAPSLCLILAQLVMCSVVTAQTNALPVNRQRAKDTKPVILFSIEPPVKDAGSKRPYVDPIAVIKGAAFAEPPMQVDGEKQAVKAFATFAAQYYKGGALYPLVENGSHHGQVTIGDVIDVSCISWTAAASPSHRLSGDRPRLVVTSTANIGLHADLDKPVTQTQHSAFLKIVQDYFRGKQLSEVDISKITIENLYSVYLGRNVPHALVGSVLSKGIKANHQLFLIADEQNGQYTLQLASYHVSTDIEESTDFVDELFLDHADLDNDGTDEIVTSSYYYESWDYTIYKLKDGQWQSVFHGSGGGC